MRRAVLLIVVGLSLPAVLAEPADLRAEEGVIDRLVNALRDPDRGVRFAAAGSLGLAGESGGDAADALVAALDDPEWCVRRQAARALRTLGRAAMPQALALLEHADADHRRAAVDVLAQLDPEGTRGLRRALSDRDEHVRFDACRALLARRKGAPEPDALDALRGLLSAKDRPLGIEAAGILVELGHPEDAVSTLATGLTTPIGVERSRMARMLAGAGRAAGPHLKTLVELLSETHDHELAREIVGLLRAFGAEVVSFLREVRTDAQHPGMYWLGRLDDELRATLLRPHELESLPVDALVRRLVLHDVGAKTPDVERELVRRGERARPALLAAMTDRRRRATVIRILAAIGRDPDLVLAYHLERLATEDEDAVADAAEALAASPALAARARPRLRSLLEDPDVSARAHRLMLRLFDPAAAPTTDLLPLLDSGSPLARAWAVRGLAGREPRVFTRAADADPRVRAAVLHALGRAHPEDPRTAVLAHAAATDPDAVVREVARDALGRPARDDPIPVVAARLGDASRDVRIEAAETLGRLGPDAVKPLRLALADPNWRVRRAACISLGDLGRDAVPAAAELVALLRDDTLAVTFAAAEALPRLGPDIAPLLPPAMMLDHYGVLSHVERIIIALGGNGAKATTGLAELLGHRDVNVREIAARSLGEIGPGAAAATPALVDALRDARISVRGRAMTALGRIGDAAAPALVEALGHADARVRGGAAYALGWVVRDANVPPLVPIEVRLPMAEPGPAMSTGFVPTPDLIARARALGALGKEGDWREALADLEPDARIDVLRAGLRTDHLPTAVACARALDVEQMDAWEAERVIELLIPECWRPGGDVDWGDFYEIMSSGEIPALLDHVALARIDEARRTNLHGAMHRLVLSNVLPTLYRMRKTPDAWVVADDEGWMPRDWSDRYRELEAPGSRTGPGLHAGLRARLEGALPWRQFVNGWLNDSVPAPTDAPLLLDVLPRLLEIGPRDDHAVDAGHAVNAVLRALGHLRDETSGRVLWSLADEHVFALAALARRGDPDAIRRLVEAAAASWDALSLLMEVRPGLGAEAFRAQLLGRTSAPDGWIGEDPLGRGIFPVATHLDDDFETIRGNGARWTSRVFRGIEDRALERISDPKRLIWIARVVPGCFTGSMVDAILAGLSRVGPQDLIDDNPDDVLPLLAAADRTGLVTILRIWARSDDATHRAFALRALARLGDAETAHEQIAWWRTAEEEEAESVDGPLPLHRGRSEAARAYYRSIAVNPDHPEEVRLDAARRLAAACGLSLPTTEAFALASDEVDVRRRFVERIVAKPSESTLRECLALLPPETTIHSLAALDPDAAREVGRSLLDRRSALSYPYAIGLLARIGDPDARAEVWSAFRVGRYRWITYQNDSDALTLGWRAESYPEWTEHLHGNCCRSGHIARLFEEIIGRDEMFSYEPHGQDATPARSFRTWLELHGGRWMRNAFETDDDHSKFESVPE